MTLHGGPWHCPLGPFSGATLSKIYASSSRDGLFGMTLLSDLLSTLRPSRHIIGLLWRIWVFQECIGYTTTRSFTYSIISYRGFNDASIHVLPYALSSPRTNRGPAANLPRLPSSDTPWDVYQRCRP